MIHFQCLKLFEDTRVGSFVAERRAVKQGLISGRAIRDLLLKDLSDDSLGFSLLANKASFDQ